MTFPLERVRHCGVGICKLKHAVLEVLDVLIAFIFQEFLQLPIATVPGLGIGGPASPQIFVAGCAADVALTVGRVGDDVYASNTRERRSPRRVFAADDGLQFTAGKTDFCKTGEVGDSQRLGSEFVNNN